MASLCSYDVGQVRAEGRRYKDDVAAYHDAMDKLMKPINNYNNTQTRWKKKKYKPTLIKTRGNHEYRIERAANETPALFGHISYADLEEEKHGWKVHDFKKPVAIDNIAYCHYFTSGVMGNPIGGINHARSLVGKGNMSSCCGHSHMRDFWETTDAIGRRMFGLVVGCYFGHDEAYTTENKRFWRGVVSLNNVCDGSGDPEFISYRQIEENYS